jgi:hypothetical protein
VEKGVSQAMKLPGMKSRVSQQYLHSADRCRVMLKDTSNILFNAADE